MYHIIVHTARIMIHGGFVMLKGRGSHKDGRPDAYAAAARCWKDCRTLHELGDDRPHIMSWFRHLASGFPYKDTKEPEPPA